MRMSYQICQASALTTHLWVSCLSFLLSLSPSLCARVKSKRSEGKKANEDFACLNEDGFSMCQKYPRTVVTHKFSLFFLIGCVLCSFHWVPFRPPRNPCRTLLRILGWVVPAPNSYCANFKWKTFSVEIAAAQLFSISNFDWQFSVEIYFSRFYYFSVVLCVSYRNVNEGEQRALYSIYLLLFFVLHCRGRGACTRNDRWSVRSQCVNWSVKPTETIHLLRVCCAPMFSHIRAKVTNLFPIRAQHLNWSYF